MHSWFVSPSLKHSGFNCEKLSITNGNSLSNISPDYTSTSLISENLPPLSLKLKQTWKDQLSCITLTLQVVPQTRKLLPGPTAPETITVKDENKIK